MISLNTVSLTGLHEEDENEKRGVDNTIYI